MLFRSARVSAITKRSIGTLLFAVLLILSVRNFRYWEKTGSEVKPNIGEQLSVLGGLLETSRSRRPSNQCRPKQNVLFLKTHKTGSSTLTNIFNRYGHSNHLSFALPPVGMFNFFWPLPFDGSFVKKLKNSEKPNILCNHARYSPGMKDFMPNATTFITILRNPVTQFESLFSYMDFSHILGLEKFHTPIAVFLENPHMYLAALNRKPDTLVSFPYLNLLRNGQLFDLGLESVDFYEDEKIREAISKVAKDFKVILIMEYFDESLILLARELCWDLENVVYFKQNERRLSDKIPKLSKEIVNKISNWNRADALLYDHFNRTLWENVRKQGNEFWKEVAALRLYNKVLEQECLVSGEHEGKVYEEQSKSVRGFALKKKMVTRLKGLCQKMTTTEINYMKYLRSRKKVD